MRLTRALLVIVDISGYTEFITRKTTSLLHAEQIITDLLDAVIERASYPLTLNKLQGDAALLFREYAPAESAAAASDVLAQVGEFFPAFKARLAAISQQRKACPCEACSNTDRLALKAFVHTGEIAVKQVRQFQELAGEPLILIHRMQKNTVVEREYVLVSDALRRLAPQALAAARPHRELLEGLGEHELWLTRPGGLPALRRQAAPAKAQAPSPAHRATGFLHLPKLTGFAALMLAIQRRLKR